MAKDVSLCQRRDFAGHKSGGRVSPLLALLLLVHVSYGWNNRVLPKRHGILLKSVHGEEGSVANREHLEAGNVSGSQSFRATTANAVIEQLDRTTDEVLGAYPSVEEAARATDTRGSSIKQVLIGKRQSSGGFYWRLKGSESLPPSERIEQVDRSTGEVLASFASIAEAARETNTVGTGIKNVLTGTLKSSAGFYWRLEGSGLLPPNKRVEQLDRYTGKVLGSFSSVAEAARQTNTDITGIYQVVGGKLESSGGFFWRKEGADSLPSSRWMGPVGLELEAFSGEETGNIGKTVDMLDLETGKVLKSFPSIVLASESIQRPASFMRSLLTSSSPIYAGFRWRSRDSEVEQLDLKTGKVLGQFRSAFEASKKTGTSSPAIGLVVHGRQKSAGGFFWRRQGSDALPPSGARIRQEKVAVEKVCLDTGEILESFESIAAASRSSGMEFFSIPRVAGGFWWRREGSTETPPTNTSRARKRIKKRMPVEQICLETHDILQTFDSYVDAANFLSVSDLNLIAVLRGTSMTCSGFFWRHAGSKALPHPKAKRRAKNRKSSYTQGPPCEKICTQSGEVLAVFDSCVEAAKSVDGKASAIAKTVAGLQKSHMGFFWRLRESDALPPKLDSPPGRPRAKRRIEQVSLETGKVLKTYESVAEAASLTATSSAGIRRVLRGELLSSGSFFWRDEGSELFPDHLTSSK